MSDSRTTPERPGEFELIANLFAPLTRELPGACGLEDDVAYLALTDGLVQAGEELVLKTDALVSGVHFLADDPGDLVARKLLRVNLSDLAAKGARPIVYMLAAMLPDSLEYGWLQRFTRRSGQNPMTARGRMARKNCEPAQYIGRRGGKSKHSRLLRPI